MGSGSFAKRHGTASFCLRTQCTRHKSIGVSEPGIFGRYRLFIFDADDTLRRTIVPGRPCPWRPEDWELLPGVQQILSRPKWNEPGGPLIGIASNQDHVGYGHLSLETARELLRD